MAKHSKKTAGRPRSYTTETVVRIRPRGATKLQSESVSKAIILMILNTRGVATIGEVNKHFGYDTTRYIHSLIRTGWLEVGK